LTHKPVWLISGIMGITINFQKGGAYDPIYQKLDNKAKVFND